MPQFMLMIHYLLECLAVLPIITNVRDFLHLSLPSSEQQPCSGFLEISTLFSSSSSSSKDWLSLHAACHFFFSFHNHLFPLRVYSDLVVWFCCKARLNLNQWNQMKSIRYLFFTPLFLFTRVSQSSKFIPFSFRLLVLFSLLFL